MQYISYVLWHRKFCRFRTAALECDLAQHGCIPAAAG